MKNRCKNKFKALIAPALIAVPLLASCVTVNSGAALAENAPIGSKVGEAKSTYFLGLWSSKGEKNNIKQAAERGGITKVAQVEYVNKSIFFGFFVKHTTRVYGE